jgi:hypothetical protein
LKTGNFKEWTTSWVRVFENRKFQRTNKLGPGIWTYWEIWNTNVNQTHRFWWIWFYCMRLFHACSIVPNRLDFSLKSTNPQRQSSPSIWDSLSLFILRTFKWTKMDLQINLTYHRIHAFKHW